MHKGAIFLLGVAALAVASALITATRANGDNVQEVVFRLGKDIHETARASGAPKFETQKVAGTISYSVTGAPKEISFRYVEEGFEVNWAPVFAFTMYGNEARGRVVESVTLQLSNKAFDDAPAGSEAEHLLAKSFIERTIAQFQSGKWQRYANSDWNVMFTGRSSYLDESGNINPNVNWSMDPAYAIPMEDWPLLVRSGVRWSWVGGGVLATLTVRYSLSDVAKFPPYKMSLEFRNLELVSQKEKEETARRLKEGDEKGWNSTAEYQEQKKRQMALNQTLIQNALKRGDNVLPPFKNGKQ